MQEITRIIEARVKVIAKMNNSDAVEIENYKKDAEKNVKETLQKLYKADDVQVEIHDFIRDMKE